MAELISILGPTAAGKTAFSIRLARELKAPVISADSVQIYRGLDIGSGKVTEEEMEGVPHYLLDVRNPDEDFSAGEYERTADALLERLFAEHDQVLLVGGAGFYFQAVWEGFDEMPALKEGVREALNTELEASGLQPLLDELQKVDAATWEVIDRNNHMRVLRALEVWRSSGKPISEFRGRKKAKAKTYRDIKVGIEVERQALYRRIEARVDMMMESGWLAEVEVVSQSCGLGCKGLQSLGYRELVSHLRGELELEEAVNLIKQNTRRYAKRQMTWFRRTKDIAWFAPEDEEQMWAHVMGQLGK